jgi:GNAT superfamily N-acetyltransferase
MTEIVYSRDSGLTVDEYIDVVGNSTLGPTRPLADLARVAAMIAGAQLIVTARLDGRCIGLARCLCDFAWVAYCGDLAVHNDFQGRGIGTGLLRACKDIVGDGVGMALISMPDAVSFYDAKGPALGMHAQPNAYFMDRVRGA